MFTNLFGSSIPTSIGITSIPHAPVNMLTPAQNLNITTTPELHVMTNQRDLDSINKFVSSLHYNPTFEESLQRLNVVSQHMATPLAQQQAMEGKAQSAIEEYFQKELQKDREYKQIIDAINELGPNPETKPEFAELDKKLQQRIKYERTLMAHKLATKEGMKGIESTITAAIGAIPAPVVNVAAPVVNVPAPIVNVQQPQVFPGFAAQPRAYARSVAEDSGIGELFKSEDDEGSSSSSSGRGSGYGRAAKARREKRAAAAPAVGGGGAGGMAALSPAQRTEAIVAAALGNPLPVAAVAAPADDDDDPGEDPGALAPLAAVERLRMGNTVYYQNSRGKWVPGVVTSTNTAAGTADVQRIILDRKTGEFRPTKYPTATREAGSLRVKKLITRF